MIYIKYDEEQGRFYQQFNGYKLEVTPRKDSNLFKDYKVNEPEYRKRVADVKFKSQ